MLRQLLSPLFSGNVRAVQSAIERMRQELDALDGPARVCDRTAFDRAIEMAARSPKECRALLDRFGQRDVAAYLIHHAAGDLVASGSYHTYRAMLSFGGFEVKRLHDWCVGQLVESGAFTGEQGASTLKTLSDDIKRAG